MYSTPGPFTGTAVGIDMKGELLVQPDDGSAVRTMPPAKFPSAA